MRKLTELLQSRPNLDQTEIGMIAYMSQAATPKMAYSGTTSARNTVSSRESLVKYGFVTVNDTNKTAQLTPTGEEVLTSENIVDEAGELTERGLELIKHYKTQKAEWQQLESFKYLSSKAFE